MFQLPPDLDPGEAVAAIVGIRPLLTKEFERITAGQWEEIGKLDKTIYRMARDLARDQLDRSSFPAIDYDRYLDALSTDLDPKQIESIVAQFPPEFHDATTAYLGQVGRTLRFLRSKFPISTYQTLFGSANLPPSDIARFKFEAILEIVDQPLSVFAMVDEGRLTSDQALALQYVAPSLYAKIVGDIVTRCALERAAEGDDFDPKFERPLAVLLAVPGIDPGLRQQLQTPKPAQAPQQQAPAPTNNKAAQAMAPASQQQQVQQQS